MPPRVSITSKRASVSRVNSAPLLICKGSLRKSWRCRKDTVLGRRPVTLMQENRGFLGRLLPGETPGEASGKRGASLGKQPKDFLLAAVFCRRTGSLLRRDVKDSGEAPAHLMLRLHEAASCQY